MFVPLNGLFEDRWITLCGDRFVDPKRKEAAYFDPLCIYKIYAGKPTEQDMLGVYYVAIFEGLTSTNEGVTLIVSPRDGARATLLHFPDDQHEVEIVEDDDDDDDF